MTTPVDEAGRWPPWRCPFDLAQVREEDLALECTEGHRFQISDGIPRFVPARSYADAFGRQWHRYRRTQLDSYTSTTISRDRARRCLGEELWESLGGKHVLECGCGAGRFTEVLLQTGAHVTSVDLSDAVDANQANFPQGPYHRVTQADVIELPFVPRQFDLVFCLGVVQHTPSPEATLASLYQHVKPGGALVFDHYAHSAAWYLSTAPLFRRWLRRLPPEEGMRCTERLVGLLFPLHSRGRRLRKVVGRISPVQTYHHAFPELSEEHQREWALLDTHDVLTDWYKWRRTVRQIRRTLNGLGLEDVWCQGAGNGIEARGRRPVPVERVAESAASAR